MKKLGIFGKLIFLLNSIAAVALVLGYILPYIPPSDFALLSVLSLSVPVLIIINFIFFLFWLLQVKKQMLLSLIALLIGINHVLSLYKFTKSEKEIQPDSFKLMSYNVKQFNIYKWKKNVDIPKEITEFVKENDPDILTMQEYYRKESEITGIFPYDFVKLKKEGAEFGMAIFSKFPIINTGSLDFPQEGNNNAIFADVIIQSDTVRIINVHLQSFRVSPYVESLKKEDSKTLLKRMASSFKKQEVQADLLVQKIKETPYKTIVAGDFNNTAFSYVYRQIKSDRFNDAFKESGNGFGQTFSNKIFPLRIDYILVDKDIEVGAFQNFNVEYSDHFPVMATMNFKD
ncbi:MAG TPA: endonuclease/exonuclease/phosphatase family protein [Salinimicrobium sp.]|nr:endonuclease/exonuclease/phosphatase family protein [Salinimicrobium sp.]